MLGGEGRDVGRKRAKTSSSSPNERKQRENDVPAKRRRLTCVSTENVCRGGKFLYNFIVFVKNFPRPPSLLGLPAIVVVYSRRSVHTAGPYLGPSSKRALEKEPSPSYRGNAVKMDVGEGDLRVWRRGGEPTAVRSDMRVWGGLMCGEITCKVRRTVNTRIVISQPGPFAFCGFISLFFDRKFSFFP